MSAEYGQSSDGKHRLYFEHPDRRINFGAVKLDEVIQKTVPK